MYTKDPSHTEASNAQMPELEWEFKNDKFYPMKPFGSTSRMPGFLSKEFVVDKLREEGSGMLPSAHSLEREGQWIADFPKVKLQGKSYLAACNSEGVVLDMAGRAIAIDGIPLYADSEFFGPSQNHQIIQNQRPALIPMEALTKIAQERSSMSQSFSQPPKSDNAQKDFFDELGKFGATYREDNRSREIFFPVAQLSLTSQGRDLREMLTELPNFPPLDNPSFMVHAKRSHLDDGEFFNEISLKNNAGEVLEPSCQTQDPWHTALLDTIEKSLKRKHEWRSSVLSQLRSKFDAPFRQTWNEEMLEMLQDTLQDTIRDPDCHKELGELQDDIENSSHHFKKEYIETLSAVQKQQSTKIGRGMLHVADGKGELLDNRLQNHIQQQDRHAQIVGYDLAWNLASITVDYVEHGNPSIEKSDIKMLNITPSQMAPFLEGISPDKLYNSVRRIDRTHRNLLATAYGYETEEIESRSESSGHALEDEEQTKEEKAANEQLEVGYMNDASPKALEHFALHQSLEGGEKVWEPRTTNRFPIDCSENWLSQFRTRTPSVSPERDAGAGSPRSTSASGASR